MRENGSGRWKTVDIQRVTRATGIPWTGYAGPVEHRPKVDPARPSHPSPLRRHRPDDGPFGVGQIVLTVVVRALMELLGGPVPGHGDLRIWVNGQYRIPHPARPLNLWNKLSGMVCEKSLRGPTDMARRLRISSRNRLTRSLISIIWKIWFRLN